MTSDWLNMLFGASAVIAFLGSIFAVVRVASLGRRRSERGQAGSNDTINRLYLVSKFLAVAAVVCFMVIETSRTERASLAGLGLLLLFVAWRRSRAADAGDVIAPVFGTSAAGEAGIRNRTNAL